MRKHKNNLGNDISIDVNGDCLHGTLSIPIQPRGVVIFAHGSGSSRFSPRNEYVAGRLNRAGLATLLIDLLTSQEENERKCIFDIDLLTTRLNAVTNWVTEETTLKDLPIGYFGASTGAASALAAAAMDDRKVAAIVCRGGRPDLAGKHLKAVRAPTLLIVGDRDPDVLELNCEAEKNLKCTKKLLLVEGATHLFEEPGALEEVATLATEWFIRFFDASRSSPLQKKHTTSAEQAA